MGRRRVRRAAAGRAPRRAGASPPTRWPTVAAILGAPTRVRRRLEQLVAPAVERSADDARRHLDRLVRPGFVLTAGSRRLPDVHRYVRGIEYRLDRLAEDIARDVRRMGEVLPLEQRYPALLAAAGRGPVGAELVDVGWLLEELRVSVFAQPLGVHGPVSPKRVRQRLDQLG